MRQPDARIRPYRSVMTGPASGTTTSDPDLAWAPVDGCTLPAASRPPRIAEFDELFATALRDVARPAAGAPQARLVLAGDAGLPARVQRLADAETACCAFFTFTVTRLDAVPGQTVVALDIEVPPARADVLEAFVDRAAGRADATQDPTDA